MWMDDSGGGGGSRTDGQGGWYIVMRLCTNISSGGMVVLRFGALTVVVFISFNNVLTCDGVRAAEERARDLVGGCARVLPRWAKSLWASSTVK
jgi:hypothetical protein